MIARAWRFFTHPAARVGAVIALAMMMLHFASALAVAVINVVSFQGAQGIQLDRFTSFVSFFQTLMTGLILLFLAITVEYASRIVGDIRQIRSHSARKRAGGGE